MGYNNYASATFPATSRKVQEIADFLDQSHIGCAVDEDGDLLCVSDELSNMGNLAIIELLKSHRIPYDHHHRDDIACNEWTDKYRLNDAGVLFEAVSEDAEDVALADFAREVLKSLEAGNTEEVYSMLRGAIEPEVADIEKLASTFEPDVEESGEDKMARTERQQSIQRNIFDECLNGILLTASNAQRRKAYARYKSAIDNDDPYAMVVQFYNDAGESVEICRDALESASPLGTNGWLLPSGLEVFFVQAR